MVATGQHERAIVAFDQVIDRGVDDPLPYLLRGKALLTKGDVDRADDGLQSGAEAQAEISPRRWRPAAWAG